MISTVDSIDSQSNELPSNHASTCWLACLQNGQSALAYAVMGDYCDIVCLLLDRNANTSLRDKVLTGCLLNKIRT